jgi:FtsP/CotA-like multicopper oxidase with cupredoxin domain
MKLFILVAVLVGYGIALDRNITLVVENGWRNPDGYWRNTITINGQTPGPAIEATKGDRLFITVKNKMLREVTTIHWHGLLLPDATYDGGSMISQYPISPGQSFLYEITATNPGTHWYHSHIPLQVRLPLRPVSRP